MFKILINSQGKIKKKSIVTIGNFDGLHLGHQKIIQEVNILAQANNYKRILITFEALPHEYFNDQLNRERYSRLSLLRDKYIVLKQQNLVDELIVIHFNAAIANMPAQTFITQILQKQLNVEYAVVGDDFKFGKGGLGNSQTLMQNNIQCKIITSIMVEGRRISSSLIRTTASCNDLSLVKKLLGRNLHYTARVVHGMKLGRKFGVPTINLTLGRVRLALCGVYIVYVYINNARYNAVASLGHNPTTNKLNVYKLEAHLLDVEIDLYGKIATIEIIKFIRHEEKYSDLKILFERIFLDIKIAKEYFANIQN
ncbi:MAG: riboflavin biosynthesis protein RibF [Pseudomonadota bacterium]|jgi:riboflavin kinase/FMN adenylyltransferase